MKFIEIHNKYIENQNNCEYVSKISDYQKFILICEFRAGFHWKANDVMMLEIKIFHRKNMDRFFFY